MAVLDMSSELFHLSKEIYSLDVIRSSILSFKNGSCQINDCGDQWSVDLASMEEPIKKSEFLRRLDEFSLRESLDKKFSDERNAIISLAFGLK